jgi:hypothetical protein
MVYIVTARLYSVKAPGLTDGQYFPLICFHLHFELHRRRNIKLCIKRMFATNSHFIKWHPPSPNSVVSSSRWNVAPRPTISGLWRTQSVVSPGSGWSHISKLLSRSGTWDVEVWSCFHTDRSSFKEAYSVFVDWFSDKSPVIVNLMVTLYTALLNSTFSPVCVCQTKHQLLP